MARTRSTKASVAAYVLCAELSGRVDLGETGPLSQGVQAGRQALRIRHVHGMEEEAQGVQVNPLNPVCVSPRVDQSLHWHALSTVQPSSMRHSASRPTPLPTPPASRAAMTEATRCSSIAPDSDP